jgi:methionyl-tRNA formyltransferase
MRIIFMGTPDFAVPALKALAESEHTVTLVVTQPDRPKGRSGQLAESDVKKCAESLGIPVFQPERVKRPEAVERLREEKPDAIVVAAYGQILSQEILDLPRYGCINIHGSLLPRWRGAAPIQWSVIDGDKKSGITIMQMDKGLDTGDILLQEAVDIAPKETAESLYDKLSALGGPLVLKALKEIEEGTAHRTPQDNEKSTYAKMLKKEMGCIDWSRPASEIDCQIRGMYPWPGTYTHHKGRILKIFSADVVSSQEIASAASTDNSRDAGTAKADSLVNSVEEKKADSVSNDIGIKMEPKDAAPGTVISVGKDSFTVACGDGALALSEVQLEGKKRMKAHDFLLGGHIKTGDVLA